MLWLVQGEQRQFHFAETDAPSILHMFVCSLLDASCELHVVCISGRKKKKPKKKPGNPQACP